MSVFVRVCVKKRRIMTTTTGMATSAGGDWKERWVNGGKCGMLMKVLVMRAAWWWQRM